MLQVITSQTDPELGNALKLASIQLHESIRKNREAMILAANNLKKITDGLIKTFENREFNTSDMRAILNGLVENASKGEYIDYAGAEQVSMAIGSIISGMDDLGVLKKIERSKLNETIEKVYLAVDNADEYKPEVFIASLKTLQKIIK